jgi:hypothetical protein
LFHLGPVLAVGPRMAQWRTILFPLLHGLLPCPLCSVTCAIPTMEGIFLHLRTHTYIKSRSFTSNTPKKQTHIVKQ